MTRPRKAGDPQKWPEACGRCAEHHKIVVRWPDGAICGYCYQQAKRTRGTCACGHEGVLPGRVDTLPACRKCSGVRLNVDCIGCGKEDELHSGNRCWSCILAMTVDRILSPPENQTPSPELQAVATALKSMKRANSGLTWIQQPHVTEFLQRLAAEPVITHARLDEIPASRTREYVRGLLVEHNALPRRDELSTRFSVWAEQALDRISSPSHRDITRRYIRWHHQRRMNQMDEVTQGTFLRAKQAVTVAIELLNWLTHQGAELAEVNQAHLDRWQAEGPTTRGIASRFLDWAIRTNLIDPSLKLQPHRRGTSPRLDAAAQTELVTNLSHMTDMNPRQRAAAILILVFGQQVSDIVQLTWDNVTVTEELVSITLGTVEIALTPPLDEPWRELAATPTHHQTAAHPNRNWVFRGGLPGQHLQASTLTEQLSTSFSSRAARLGTLHELTKLAPVAIIAEALGYSPATIDRHALVASANYMEYMSVLTPSLCAQDLPLGH
jgi:integrase